MGFFSKLKEGLQKTRDAMMHQVDQVLKAFGKVDEALFEELEEVLISADVGVKTSGKIVERLRAGAKERHITDPGEIREALREIVTEMLGDAKPLSLGHHPTVILVVGVNGVGKTTTIGKLAASLHGEGKSVMLAAADTFRAAAIDQLQVWADRANVPMIRHGEGADPAAVIYDAISSAKAKDIDVLICDTAGRLHNKKHLMDELSKISRVILREVPAEAVEVFLIVDASTGQNGLNQAKLFGEAAGITGMVLTKLDGTAKGGVVIAIADEMSIPIRYIGVGEGVHDLEPFDTKAFAEALFEV